MHRWWHLTLFTSLFFLVILSFFLVYVLFFSRGVSLHGQSDEDGSWTSWEEIVPPPDPLRVIYVAIMGYGGGSHAGGSLADTIIVAQIIPRAQLINLYSVPRDLWVKFPFTASETGEQAFYAKINNTLAIGNSANYYTWRPAEYQGKNGGGALAKAVLADVIGVPIDYFVAVDFSGFKRLIKLVAGEQGLQVDVPYSFTDYYYPLEGKEEDACGKSEEEIAALTATLSGYTLEQEFTCRYETLEFTRGSHYLDAETLLKFVRSRHAGTGGGDFGRSQRQQVVLEAVKKRLLSVSLIPKLPELISQGLQLVQTDISLELIKATLIDYGDLADFTLKSQVIDNRNLLQDARAGGGQYVLWPRVGQNDYHEIWALIQQGLAASGSALIVSD